MKTTLLPLLAALLLAPAAWAQDRIYRCGNEYTNNVSEAKSRGCKLVEGGNVTVLGTVPSRPSSSVGTARGSGSSAAPPAVSSSADQRARDADQRAILEAELRKAETRRADLAKEYNNGAPERLALELTNPQLYQARIEQLKEALTRAESDVAGIRRELGRVPPAN
ncbi:MAG: hypothetical protein QM740_15590 [Acidovorax sp.]